MEPPPPKKTKPINSCSGGHAAVKSYTSLTGLSSLSTCMKASLLKSPIGCNSHINHVHDISTRWKHQSGSSWVMGELTGGQ